MLQSYACENDNQDKFYTALCLIKTSLFARENHKTSLLSSPNKQKAILTNNFVFIFEIPKHFQCSNVPKYLCSKYFLIYTVINHEKYLQRYLHCEVTCELWDRSQSVLNPSESVLLVDEYPEEAWATTLLWGRGLLLLLLWERMRRGESGLSRSSSVSEVVRLQL